MSTPTTAPAEPQPDGGIEPLSALAERARVLSRRFEQASSSDWAGLEAETTHLGQQLTEHADRLAAEATRDNPEPVMDDATRDAIEASQREQTRYDNAVRKWGAFAVGNRINRFLPPTGQHADEGTPLWDEMQDAARAMQTARKERDRTGWYEKVKEHRRQTVTAYADAYRQVLAEVRPMGGTITTSKGSSKASSELLEAIAGHYPSAWIDLSNQQGQLVVKTTTTRAHYRERNVSQVRTKAGDRGEAVLHKPKGWSPDEDPARFEGWQKTGEEFIYRTRNPITGRKSEELKDGWYGPDWRVRHVDPSDPDTPPAEYGTWEKFTYTEPHSSREKTVWRSRAGTGKTVKITSVLTTDGDSTTAHEFAHRCEHVNPTIGELTDAFIVRRTTLPTGTREPLRPYQQSRTEKVRPDGFVDVYMGKDYSNSRYHEVLSTGVEALFHGQFGGLLGDGDRRRDDDMRHFLLGVLASA